MSYVLRCAGMQVVLVSNYTEALDILEGVSDFVQGC